MSDAGHELDQLRRAIERLERGVEGAQLGLWDHDFRTDEVVRNRRWAEMLGYDPDEVPRAIQSWRQLIHPDDLAEVDAAARAHRDGETSMYRVEHRMRARSGEWVWVLNWGRVIERDEAGRPLRAVGIHLDITDRKRVEHALRESEIRFRQLCDLVPQSVLELDLSGHVTYMNRHGYEASGRVGEESVCGLSVEDLFAPYERDRLRHRVYQMIRGEPLASTEFQALRGEGQHYPALVYGRPMHRDGAVVGAIVTMVDITERKRAEAELSRADKLESIGTLAGGIAHDFNNILSAVIGNLSLARCETDDDTAIAPLLDEAERAALRARDLTAQLLAFAKGGAPVRKPTSIEDLLRESAAFALHGSNVRCEFDLAAGLPSVDVSGVQIHQVFNNLLINAAQAMPQGGVVSIHAAATELPVDSGLPVLPGSYLRVEVADRGVGIPEDDLSRIFDPFFTTKAGGSGLGLATSYAIVRRHEGHIAVESRAGEGTTFTIHLPATDQPAERSEPDDLGPRVGRGRVLVVDDEEPVRRLTYAALARLGYDSELASDGQLGVDTYVRALRRGKPFDVVLMDLTIPGGVGGTEALKKLREVDASVRAIVCSGYSSDPVMSNHERYGFIGRLQKPFRIADLSRVLQEALPAGSQPAEEDHA